MPDTNETPRSIDDIAASMVVSAPEEKVASDSGGASEASPASAIADVSGTQDAAQDETIEEEGNTPLTEEDTAQDDPEDEASGEPEEDAHASSDTDEDEDVLDNLFDADQEGADEAASTDGLDTSTLGDDAMFSVTVDGEETQVPLGELKQRYAGEGAIDKRLQEATEHRNAIVSDYEQSKQLTEAVMQQFGQSLFRRTVPEPPIDMLRSDPQNYQIQKTLYDQENNALVQEHQKLHNLMAQMDEVNTKAKAQRREAAALELRRVMPVFNDPVKGPKVREALVDAATEIGFTPAQIAECEDPLIFKAVALAARELRRQRGAKVEAVVPKSRTTRGAGTKNKAVATSSQRKEKDAFQKARTTGSVDDVAATMVVKQPRKRGRR